MSKAKNEVETVVEEVTGEVENESTDMAIKEAEAQEIALMEEEMAIAAAEMKANLGASSNRIRNNGKQFTLPDGTVAGSELKIVILGHVRAHALFQGTYNPNNPESPICAALGQKESEMKPTDGVEKPQAPSCSECPSNEWGSATNGGKGKECKNSYNVLVVCPDYSTTDTAILTIAATGMTNFDTSMKGIIKGCGHPTQAIVTAEFMDSTFPVVKITSKDIVPNPDKLAHFGLSKGALEELTE